MSSRNTRWDNIPQQGEGSWEYDQDQITYDQLLDPLALLDLKYNGIGDLTVWTNLDLI